MEVTRWLMQHGESLLEGIGIVGGLIFTGLGLHRDSRARRVENLLTITQHHRELWRSLDANGALARAFDGQRDALRDPPSQEERRFIRSAILHLGTVYRAIKLDEVLKPQGMDADIRAFFAKPIPHDVWNDEKRFQDKDFVAYIDRLLS